MIYAPVIIGTLNRHSHLERELNSLASNSWAGFTDVYVVVDYPPSEKYVDGFTQVCSLLEGFDGSRFASFTVIRRERNYGAGTNAWSFIHDVIAKRYDRWISAEDDLEFAPNFLEYMDKCLEAYKDDKSVMAVCGYSYPLDWAHAPGTTAFMTQATFAAWGCGWWRDKYAELHDDIVHGHYLRREAARALKSGVVNSMIEGRRCEYITYATFNLGSSLMERTADVALGPYMTLKNRRVVVPTMSKTRNWGFDGSGTYTDAIGHEATGKHSQDYDYSRQPLDSSPTFDLNVDVDSGNARRNAELLDKFLYVPPQTRRQASLGMFVYRIAGLRGCYALANSRARRLVRKVRQSLASLRRGLRRE